MHWLAKFDALPPNVCRLIAKEPHKMKQARTTETIAKISGFSKQKVIAISRLRSWKTVSLGDFEAFELGCGVTPGQEVRARAYVERTKKMRQGFYHLRRLMKQKKDKRLEKFLVDLMLPK